MHPTRILGRLDPRRFFFLRIDWLDIESLLVTCGAQILEGDGSAIRIVLGNRRAYMHRPHPQKEAKAYQVKAIRELLQSAGIKP